MAVPKVAVIALIAIVAIPILLGYGMNIAQTTVTDYKTAGEAVNVTPLIMDESSYNTVAASIYQLNTSAREGQYIIPYYESITSNQTSVGMVREEYDDWKPATEHVLSHWKIYSYIFDYDATICNIILNITKNDSTTQNVQYLHTIYYSSSEPGVIRLTYYSADGLNTYTSLIQNVASVKYSNSGTLSDHATGYHWNTDNPNLYGKYADLSAGFHLKGYVSNRWSVWMPDRTSSVLMTIDLDSITDSDYQFTVSAGSAILIFNKTTVAGDVTWTYRENSDSPSDAQEIYYDDSSSNNVYQLNYRVSKLRETVSPAMTYYNTHTDLRYIGAWPDLIGEANHYFQYERDFERTIGSINADYSIKAVGIFVNNPSHTYVRTPTIRMDGALYGAFQFPVIMDRTYDPSQFKDNPSTVINDPQIYGTSIEFGGNTYTVKDGNITMGTHQIPVKGLVLSSVPNAGGGYDNKIGDTIVSATATPSTIRFNGIWSASISTSAQESYTYYETKWEAGTFAWSPTDHNFLMAGLVTCLGTFVCCGIYLRITKSKGVIPLMIITGGASLVFFIML